MRKRIAIAAPVDATLISGLTEREEFEIIYRPVDSEADLSELLRDAHVAITRHHNRVTPAVLDSAHNLELIAQATSGIDNIDLEALGRRRITLLHVGGENANAVAEWVLACAISLSRTIPMYTAMTRAGRWDRDDCSHRRELRGRVAGIVGLGRVGTAVARLLSAVGCEAVAYDPYIAPAEFETRHSRQIGSLNELLTVCDIVTLHVPLTSETRDMITGRELALLRPHAIVLNASRGPVVDLPALLGALRESRIGGAALDVFPEEPPQNIEWPDDPRLILTPHVAGCTRESKESAGRLLFERLLEHYGLRDTIRTPSR